MRALEERVAALESELSALRAEIASLHGAEAEPAGPRPALKVCSFNIKWLGHYRNKDHAFLADLLADYDIVAVQELVSNPDPVLLPTGTLRDADEEADAFFDAMQSVGFNYWLSPEDTGQSETLFQNGPQTEWWVVFYKVSRVVPANDLPAGFVAEDRSANPVFARVPYAFPFRAAGAGADFVLVSVHLEAAANARDRRREELAAIASWTDSAGGGERDFILLGDMNIQSADELAYCLPGGFRSLNEACVATNVNPGSPRPYDHVMYRESWSSEIDTDFGFRVVNLLDEVEAVNPADAALTVNAFGARYSDHCPVVFQIKIDGPDDD